MQLTQAFITVFACPKRYIKIHYAFRNSWNEFYLKIMFVFFYFVPFQISLSAN